jgi:hypothetical protein
MDDQSQTVEGSAVNCLLRVKPGRSVIATLIDQSTANVFIELDRPRVQQDLVRRTANLRFLR